MPTLSDQEKSYVLEKMGYDPSAYDVDENNAVVPREVQKREQPTVSSGVGIAKINPSAVQTFSPDTPATTAKKHWLHGAVPAIAGGLGAGGGWMLGASLAPVMGPAALAVPLLTSLGTGALSSMFAGAGQRAILDELGPNVEKNLALSAQQNPKSAIAGQIGTLPLGGFVPNIKNMGSGLRGLVNVFGPGATAQEAQNLANMGIGAGLSAGLPYAEASVHNLISDNQVPYPTLGETARNAITGGAFSTPWALGKAYGFHGADQIAPSEPTADMLNRSSQEVNPQPMSDLTAKQQLNQLLSAGGAPISRDLQPGVNTRDAKGKIPPLKNVDIRSDKTATWKKTPEPVDIQTFEGEGGPDPEVQLQAKNAELQKKIEQEKRISNLENIRQEQMAELAKLQEANKKSREYELMQSEETAKEQTVRENVQKGQEKLANRREVQKGTKTLQEEMQANQVATKPEEIVPPIATTETGTDIMPDFTGTTEHDNAEVAKETDLPERHQEGFTDDKYSTESQGNKFRVDALNALAVSRGEAALEHIEKFNPSNKERLYLKSLVSQLKGKTDRMLTSSIRKTALDYANSNEKYSTGTKPKEGTLTPLTHSQQERSESLKDVEQTPKWVEWFKKLGIEKRGVKLEEVNKLINSKGEEVEGAGLSMPRKAAEIAKSFLKRGNFGADTPPHELLHPFYGDLAKSKRPADVAFRNKSEKSIGSTEDYLWWKGEREAAGQQSSVEEYLTTDTGEYAVKRALEEGGEPSMKKWWGDYKAYIKTRYGKHASPEDFQRMFLYKLYHDKPFDASNVRANVNAAKPEEDKLSTETLGRLKVLGEDETPRYTGENAEELKTRLQHSLIKEPVYHFSRIPFERADGEVVKNVSPIGSTFGMHVGTKEQAAFRSNDYLAENKVGNTQKYYIDLRNPYRVNDSEANLPNMLAGKMHYDRLLSQKDYNDFHKVGENKDSREYFRERGKFLTDILKKNGFDGLIYDNSVEGKGDSYVIFDKKQLVNAISQKRAPEGDLYSVKSMLSKRLYQPEIDKVGKIDHPEAKNLAKAMTEQLEYQRQYSGAFNNKIIGQLLKHVPNVIENPKEYWLLNNEKLSNAVKYIYEMQDHGSSSIKADPTILKNIRDLMKEMTAEQNSRGLRNATITENTLPQLPSRPTLDTLLNKKDPAKVAQLQKDWQNYYTRVLGKSQKETDDAADLFYKGFLDRKPDTASHYGPIDREDNLLLPPSWRSTDAIDVMSRIASRYGRRIAFKRAFEDKPNVMKALQEKEGIGANESVQNVMEDIRGQREMQEANRSAISGVVRAAMLGPITGSKDLVTAHFLAMQHMDLGDVVPSWISTWKDIRQNWKHSFDSGINKHNIGALEFSESEGGVGAIPENLRRLRDVTNEGQGRNILEKTSRSVDVGIGRYMGQAVLQSAKRNSMSSQHQKFARDFFPENWQQYKKAGVFPEKVLNEIAAKFTESVQGTYDYRGLPKITQKGSLAPYLSLSRWSIEKLNNFEKHVVVPATKGEFKPLLMATLAGVIGGEAVNQLVQLTTKRKEKTSSVGEIAELANEGNLSVKTLTYKLAALASYGGFAGIAGDALKMGMDKMNKNNMQAFDNPLISFGKTVWQNATDLYDAIDSGDLSITGDAISQFLEDTFQAYRLAITHLSPEKQKEIDRQNKSRDLREFKQSHGQPVPNVSADRGNPFKDKEAKEFKRTDDMQRATELLPLLIQKAIDKADGDPMVLHSELQKLKGNSYQTMPNPNVPENLPSFVEYYQWLQKTQGKDEAAERLADYLLQNEKNKAKSSLVP